MNTRLALTGLVLGLAACSQSQPHEGSSANLELAVRALTFEGVADVAYHLRVDSALGPVWQGDLRAARFGDGQSLSYVAPCDASPEAQPHTISLRIDGLYDGEGALIDPGSWTNPSVPTPLSVTATCRENADTLVALDLTLMRRANQGFFDVAVSFQDIFCSAKLDCVDENGGPLELVHGDSGERLPSVVLALSCLDTNSEDLRVYMTDPVLDCGDGPVKLYLDRGPGHLYVDPEDPPAPFAEAMRFSGVQTYTNASTGETARGLYLTAAFSLDFQAIDGACTLFAEATAYDGQLPEFQTPPQSAFPLITWDLPIVAAGADAYSCTRHALDGGDGVSTRYTALTERKTFDIMEYRFEGPPEEARIRRIRACDTTPGVTCCDAPAECPSGDACFEGSCCTPSCAGLECGSDGCGGTCGTCSGEQSCTTDGQCDYDWQPMGDDLCHTVDGVFTGWADPPEPTWCEWKAPAPVAGPFTTYFHFDYPPADPSNDPRLLHMMLAGITCTEAMTSDEGFVVAVSTDGGATSWRVVVTREGGVRFVLRDGIDVTSLGLVAGAIGFASNPYSTQPEYMLELAVPSGAGAFTYQIVGAPSACSSGGTIIIRGECDEGGGGRVRPSGGTGEAGSDSVPGGGVIVVPGDFSDTTTFELDGVTIDPEHRDGDSAIIRLPDTLPDGDHTLRVCEGGECTSQTITQGEQGGVINPPGSSSDADGDFQGATPGTDGIDFQWSNTQPINGERSHHCTHRSVLDDKTCWVLDWTGGGFADGGDLTIYAGTSDGERLVVQGHDDGTVSAWIDGRPLTVTGGVQATYSPWAGGTALVMEVCLTLPWDTFTMALSGPCTTDPSGLCDEAASDVTVLGSGYVVEVPTSEPRLVASYPEDDPGVAGTGALAAPSLGDWPAVGDPLFLRASGLDATQGAAVLRFSSTGAGVSAAPTHWRTTRVRAPIPTGAVSGPLRVLGSSGGDTPPTYQRVAGTDGDGDGIDDAFDNCAGVPNPTQDDLDADGLGDLCDVDLDADLRWNSFDNCPRLANPPWTDTDKDGVGDLCDAFPNDPDESQDSDGDGTGDALDCAPLDPLHVAPDCTGRVCGDDGCGGSCGTCGVGQECMSGQCGSECDVLICAAGEYATADFTCESLPPGPAITVSGTVLLDVATLEPGRAHPEQVSFRVASIAGATVTLSAAPAGLAPGDEVLVINLMGSPAGTDHVGTNELGLVASISGAEVTLVRGLRKTYAVAGNADLSAEVVRLVRVPVYASLTLASGATLTARPFDPTTGEGGIVAVDVLGPVTFADATSSISAKQLGYPGGGGGVHAAGISTTSNRGYPGTGPAGPATARGQAQNAGGGGGGLAYRCAASPADCGAGGGGGADYGVGLKSPSGGTSGGLGGVPYAYDPDPRWLMGAGGGGGAADPTGGGESSGSGRNGVAGGRGGGLVFMRAGSVSGPGLVRADGQDVTTSTTSGPHEEGSGGAGAGGTIMLVGAFAHPTTDITGGVVTNCNYCGGAGGVGRVLSDTGIQWSPPVVSGALVSGNPGRWADGTVAASCADYQPPPGSAYCAATDNGVYLVDPDGGDPGDAIEVTCDFDAGTEVPVCPDGYSGNPCAPICDEPCLNGGVCGMPDTCDCSGTDYGGPTCADPVCAPACQHGGVCVAPNVCDCTDTGFEGASCETADPTCPTSGECPFGEYLDADGDCVAFAPGVPLSVSAATNLTTYTSAGRSHPDQVFYRVQSIADATVTLTAAPNGITAGDEVLVINLMGTPTDYAQVGTYELGVVESVDATSVTLVRPLSGLYSLGGNADLSSQVVRVVRVPHYSSVSITGTGSITSSAFGTGAGSGVVALHVDDTLTLATGTSLTAASLGYAGGAAGSGGSALNAIGTYGFPGTGIAGPAAARSRAQNFGGGGGGRSYSCGSGGDCGSGGGGGGHASAGGVGVGGANLEGLAGEAYASAGDERLYLGAGGGGGGADATGTGGDSASGTAGGAGGGVLFVRARAIANSGTISVRGTNAGTNPNSTAEEGAGGAGGGGTLVIIGAGTFGTPVITGGVRPTCDACGGVGGTGRTLQPEAVLVSGALTSVDPGLWSTGSYALSCAEYVQCSTAGPGVYLVDIDGGDPANAFLAQCAADGTMTPL